MLRTIPCVSWFWIFAIVFLPRALMSCGNDVWVRRCSVGAPWRSDAILQTFRSHRRSSRRSVVLAGTVAAPLCRNHAEDCASARKTTLTRVCSAFLCTAPSALGKRHMFVLPTSSPSNRVCSMPEANQANDGAQGDPHPNAAAVHQDEAAFAPLQTTAFLEARRKASVEVAEKLSRADRTGILPVELPGDDILSRPYPSFEAPSQYLPPLGVDNLPTDPAVAGASAAAEASFCVSQKATDLTKLQPLGDPRSPIGALGQGGRLWNVLGMDDEKVSREVEKEVEFVKQRWLERLRAVHEHSRTWQEGQRERQIRKIRRLTPPKWIIPINAKHLDAPGPLDYDFKTYGPQLAKMVAVTQSQVSTSSVFYEASKNFYVEVPVTREIPTSALRDIARKNLTEGRVYGPAVSGFRLKQVTPPFVHQRGIAAFFYFHAPHSTIYPPFINACRRESFDLPRPAVTAIKIENADSFIDAPPPHASRLAALALQRRIKKQQLIYQIEDTKRRIELTRGGLDKDDVDTKDEGHHKHGKLFLLQQQLSIFERQLKYVQDLINDEKHDSKGLHGFPASMHVNKLPVPHVTSVIGMREDTEDLIENLRKIIFRRKPRSRIEEMLERHSKEGNKANNGGVKRKGTFKNPWVASLSVKGPISVVAGDLQLPSDLEIINKSQYLCTMCANYYLNFQIKIEEINEFVLPEYGIDSLNRDIDSEGFYYFSSYVAPVPSFGFDAQRVPESLSSYREAEKHQRAAQEFSVSSFESLQKRRFNRDPASDLFPTHYQRVVPWKYSCDLRQSSSIAQCADTKHAATRVAGEKHSHNRFPFESVGEVVTIELHTDGSATPRQALLECLDRFESLTKRVSSAVVENCKITRDGTIDDLFKDPEITKDKHRFIGVPWNPYKGSIARDMDRHKTFFRKDIIRQYSPVKEQLMARREIFGLTQARALQSETGSAAEESHNTLQRDIQERLHNNDANKLDANSSHVVSEEEIQERLLDEEELEEELVERSPTIRLEREREYQAAVQFLKDLREGEKIKGRGDGQGMPPFHTKFEGLEDPPDWVFEDFMAQRIPVGLLAGIQDD